MKSYLYRIPLYLAVLSITMFLIVSCTSVDYQGEKLSAVPSSEPVIFITDVTTRPDAERVLGYAEMNVGPSIKSTDIRDALRKKARSVGANVIRIISMKKVPDGKARMDQRYNTSSPNRTWNVQDTSDTAFNNIREGLTTSSDTDTPGLVSGLLSGSNAVSDDKNVYRTYVKAEFRVLRDF